MDSEFKKLLLDVDKGLSDSDVKALCFLCHDLLGRKTTALESALKLFDCLINQGYLSPEEPEILIELLSTMKCQQLLRKLGLECKDCSPKHQISPYRKFLYSLSRDISDKELSQVKFMLGNKLDRKKHKESVTTLEVFLELERSDFINETNLSLLETIFENVSPLLNREIKKFTSLEENRMSRSRSSSDPNQKPVPKGNKSLRKTSSQKEQRSSRTPSETEELEEYCMARANRGVCVIVNNFQFKHRPRKGTMADENSLKVVFTWLGFEVVIHRDCDRETILSMLKELGRRDHSQEDCFVCCILSHGELGGVFGVDGNIVKLEELMDPFDGLKCHSLLEKPKLFFIQACQGKDTQKAVEVDGPEEDSISCDAFPSPSSVPSKADFLVGMATIPLFVSFRHHTEGTWYIQTLCKNLVEMVPRGYDLVSILTKVNADVSKMTDSIGLKKQMPQPYFTLRKKVVFPIPNTTPPTLQ